MGMNLDRFSRAAFEALAPDSLAARQLADRLQAAILAEVAAAAKDRFQSVVATLNSLGHCLTPYEQEFGDEEFRDYTNPDQCALRVGLDIIISAGYKDSHGEGGWGELSWDEDCK